MMYKEHDKKVIILLASLLAGFLPEAANALPDFADILYHVQTQLGQVTRLLVAVCYVAGIWLVFRGILKFKAYGDMRVMMSNHANMTEPVILMMIGAILIFFPNTLDVSVQTFWGYNYASAISYPIDASGKWGAIAGPLTSLVQVVGIISFMKGWFILSKVTSQGYQPGTVGKGIMHILAGILAINIGGTVDMLHATLFGY